MTTEELHSAMNYLDSGLIEEAVLAPKSVRFRWKPLAAVACFVVLLAGIGVRMLPRTGSGKSADVPVFSEVAAAVCEGAAEPAAAPEVPAEAPSVASVGISMDSSPESKTVGESIQDKTPDLTSYLPDAPEGMVQDEFYSYTKADGTILRYWKGDSGSLFWIVRTNNPGGAIPAAELTPELLMGFGNSRFVLSLDYGGAFVEVEAECVDLNWLYLQFSSLPRS